MVTARYNGGIRRAIACGSCCNTGTAGSPRRRSEGPGRTGRSLFGFVALVVIGALMTDGPPADYSSVPAEAGIARLQFSWVDATEELMRMVQQLTPDEQALLGLAVLTTGSDFYGARIYLANTGNMPIRVGPEKVIIHFGGEAATVSTGNDRRFLRQTTLQPGQSTNGLVAFHARMDIGAAIRLGGGAMSYEDPTIEVVYR